jgi:hypothetical protein
LWLACGETKERKKEKKGKKEKKRKKKKEEKRNGEKKNGKKQKGQKNAKGRLTVSRSRQNRQRIFQRRRSLSWMAFSLARIQGTLTALINQMIVRPTHAMRFVRPVSARCLH